MGKQCITFENGAAKVDMFSLVQTEAFQGQMAAEAAKMNATVRSRLQRAGYKLATGIWSGDKLAREYRTILMNGSSRPATERMYIRLVGDAALQTLIDKAEAAEKERLAAPAPVVKKTARKTRRPEDSGQ